jgi:hypothetical protein
MHEGIEAEIERYFEQYEVATELLEPVTWRATFANESDAEFDLYVMVGEEWVHFAISPFISRPAAPEQAAKLWEQLLRLNQEVRLARFGLDDDGDVNLLAELPRRHFGYAEFALVLDELTHYANRLAPELERLGRNR